MNRGIERAEHLFRRIIKLEEAICVVLQIIMLVICFAAVVKRYFFNAPWAWTDEIQLLLLVIYGYLGILHELRRKCGRVCSRFALSVRSLRQPPKKILISPV